MSDKPTRYDLREILRQSTIHEESFEDKVKLIKGYTLGVDSSTSPAVSGRSKYVWFRESGLNGAVHQILNPDKIPLLVNFPCLAMYNPKKPFRWEIYGADWDQVYELDGYTDQNFGVGTHAPNHEWPDGAPGTDPLNVYPRAFTSLRTSAGTGLTVNVSAYRHWHDDIIKVFTGIYNFDLSALQPAAGYARRVLIYLEKATNAIVAVAGTQIGDSEIVVPPDPNIPIDSILSAFVRLDGSQTSFTESDIVDLRMHLTETSTFDINTVMTDDEGDVMVDDEGNIMVVS